MVQFLPFLVVAIVFTVVSTTDYDFENCVEGKNNEKICAVKPTYFDEFMKAMNTSVHEDFELINTWRGGDLEEIEYNYNGSELNCPSVTRVLRPFLYMGGADKKLVVQTDVFKQKIQTTECIDKSVTDMDSGESECFKPLAFGWRGKCKNKYSAMDIVLYNMEKQEIEKISMEIPVWCSCSIYK